MKRELAKVFGAEGFHLLLKLKELLLVSSRPSISFRLRYIRAEVGGGQRTQRAMRRFGGFLILFLMLVCITPALKPGEMKTVNFRVSQEQLAIWNAERKWVVETGTYRIWVGGSSQALLTTNLLLTP